MTPRDFCYFMQSLFEVADMKKFNEKQTEIIKNHLQLVFVHDIDPANHAGDKHVKEVLQAIHDGRTPPPMPDILLRGSTMVKANC